MFKAIVLIVVLVMVSVLGVGSVLLMFDKDKL